ncbi:MAG: RcnB family protein [Gammaproteobacteria bacterium]|nr:RcnB family protein [Gammaproteobacteria bacterium]
MIRFAASTLVLALAASSAALADSPHRGGHEIQRHGDQRWQNRSDDRHGWRNGHDRRDPYAGRRGHDWRSHAYGNRAPRYYGYTPHGHYSGHRWARGQWLPVEYRARPYYVADYWRYGHRVYAPPAGCGWVRRDGDLILMALATGLVLDVVYDAYDY